MKLVYKFRIKNSKQLKQLCEVSKNLYNQANFIIRQNFIKEKTFFNYYKMDKIMKDEKNLDNKVNYRLLPAQTSQQVLKLLDKNWKSFFASIKDWRKHPNKYKGKPNLPNYLRKKQFLLFFTNQTCKIINNRIKQKKFNINIRIPKYKGKSFEKFQQVRIIPKNSYYEGEVVYEQNIINSKVDVNKVLSIDLGVNNLVTMVTSEGDTPIIVNGKSLKSANQFFNKKIAKLKSIRTNGKSVKDKEFFKNTKLMNSVTLKRNSIINDYFHKTSKFIINYCLKKGIGLICVGELKGMKTSCKLGKSLNQQNSLIPFLSLKNKLKYKCKLVGIKLKEVNEAYTSKCDALGVESIKKHSVYMGERVKRGLFKSVNGLINSDVNGALNILRKVIGNTFIKKLSNSGVLFNPVKIRNINSLNSLQTVFNKNVNFI